MANAAGGTSGGNSAFGGAVSGGMNGGGQGGSAPAGGSAGRNSGGEASLAGAGGAGGNALPPNTIASPNQRIVAELSTTQGALRYRITVDGKQILAPSEIGLRSDGVELGQDAVLGSFVTRPIDQQYPLFGGRATAVEQANEAVVPVTSGSESYTLDVHVANDGVGLRLRLPAKKGRKIEADRSAWRFEGDPTVWVTAQDPSYEQPYRSKTWSTLGTSNYGMPLTAKVGSTYVSITESTVKDYGDLGLKAGNGVLQGYLYADTAGWTTDAAVTQPWRVTVIADDLTALANSTLVQNLAPPKDSSLANADWIKPGRSSWQWMAIGAPLFADQHQWVDWTQELGFEYYLIDDGWKAWSNAWQSLQSVVTYAASKQVKLWLWVNSNEIMDATARRNYFKQAASAGVVGVKIDFVPACSRNVANWYWDTAKDAAENKLLVDFHGAAKPTGMERTWPNVLTREAIRGHEYQMTRYSRVQESPHDTILPFTRGVAGAGDYTPTVFATKELQGNTWAHELAQAIVFVSPFLCYGGHPQDYVANSAVDVLKAIPAVWDETVVLPGSDLGKVAAIARRSGKSWFVGVVNGADATTLSVPLTFLGTGPWQSVRLGDVNGKGDAWDRQVGDVSASDTLTIKLSSRGGFVGWFKQ